MSYSPEGVLRPTPPEADNETEFVYDYFIKDYLGNVRVVLTEENAYYTEKFLSTLEEAHREIEERNFDNVGETAEDLPTGYPVDGSAELNEKIALLSAANGTEIGPSIVMPVRRGDQVSLRTDYFYTENAPGATYDNLNTLVNEVLLALAASGSGVLRLTEGQLIDLAAGGNQYSAAIGSFFSSSFDTTDVSKPFGYLVWMLYDNDMNLLPAGSGAKRVTDPNELKDLLEENIPVVQDGYLHAYVSNGSASNVSFDNFLITYMRGNTRQINHYYPYGLSIDGLDHSDEYLNKYTSKELQTGEFFSQTSSGLEMFDFGSRFYDPQVGRWFTPDPAEQFHNPYLAMGNNPVMYVDPDGEFIFTASAIIIGAMIGSFTGAVAAGYSGATNGQIMASFGIGGLAGAVSAGIGTSEIAFANTLGIASGSTITSFGNSKVYGTDVSTNFGAFSVNWTDGKFETFSSDNSFLENLGYGLGAFANISDTYSVLSGVNSSNSGTVKLQSDSHSSVHDIDGKALLDVGVDKPISQVTPKEGIFGSLDLSVDYRAHQKLLNQPVHNTPLLRMQKINQVRIDKLLDYKQNLLDSGKGFGLFNIFGGKNVNCSFAASMGLLKGGVFNIPIGVPGFLSIQMYARQYSYMSYLLNDDGR